MADDKDYRIELDSMGEVRVPRAALYKAQTQRAVENFPISGTRFSRTFIRALGLVKSAAAAVNCDLDLMPADMAQAIQAAAAEVADGEHDDQFPIDIFQTGSGTSTNMNANEVIATLASAKLGQPVHPNDHVNMGQSSNDVIPTAIHVAAYLETSEVTLPGMARLCSALTAKAESLDDVVKMGRTHLMDALPIRLSQELGGWVRADGTGPAEGARVAFADFAARPRGHGGRHGSERPPGIWPEGGEATYRLRLAFRSSPAATTSSASPARTQR